VAACDLPGSGEILVVVDLHPFDIADGNRCDRTATVDERLKAVLVEQIWVTLPGALERPTQMTAGGGVDEGRADVRGVSKRRHQELADPGDPPGGVDREFHLLLGEWLRIVHRKDEAAPAPPGEEGPLYARRMHRVPIDKQHTFPQVIASQPEGIAVVPLRGPVVMDEAQAHSVGLLERLVPAEDGIGPVADDEDNVGDLHAGEITQREIEDGQLIRNSEKRLREVVGMRPQSATRSRS